MVSSVRVPERVSMLGNSGNSGEIKPKLAKWYTDTSAREAQMRRGEDTINCKLQTNVKHPGSNGKRDTTSWDLLVVHNKVLRYQHYFDLAVFTLQMTVMLYLV